jgi:2-oxo-3-hexenedioate decarboxylase
MTPTAGITAITNEVLAALTTHRQVAAFSSRPGGLTLADAYGVTPRLRAAFEARGETVIGRKIGFTNRNIWAQYGVYAPIWGYVTDSTTCDLARTSARRASDFAEPRIEPEIMFALKAEPAPDMNEAALLDCIEWVSFGYEIVQSIFPGWKFAPPDTVAANALHGALYIGARHAVAPRQTEWLRELATFEAELSCNGRVVDRGGGAAVLDSPLSALRHLVGMLARRHAQSAAACR